MRFLKILLGVLVLAAAALAVAWRAAEPAPLPANSRSAVLLQPGPFAVEQARFELVDSTRPTDRNGDFAGAPARTLATRAWYPRSNAQHVAPPSPLVIWSHGFFGNNGEPAYIAEHLASHGYVVVAADFPLTNYKAPGGATVYDVINQPGDVSFLIDTWLARNADANSPFHGRIDPERIAIAGLSLGGLTTELTAYHPRLRDPRIKAAVSLAGPLQFLERPFFAGSQLPFLMIAGDIDAMIPYADNARPVLERIDNAWLVSIRGASHTGFADQASFMRLLDNPDSIGCRFVRDRIPPASTDTGFIDRIGSEAEGVSRHFDQRVCQLDPLPSAISPLVQHRITVLAIASFLTSILDPDPAQRSAASDFLQNVLARENAGVTVERSAPP